MGNDDVCIDCFQNFFHLVRSMFERRNIRMFTVEGFSWLRFFETVLPLSEKLFSDMALAAGTARMDRAARARMGQVDAFDFHQSRIPVPEVSSSASFIILFSDLESVYASYACSSAMTRISKVVAFGAPSISS